MFMFFICLFLGVYKEYPTLSLPNYRRGLKAMSTPTPVIFIDFNIENIIPTSIIFIIFGISVIFIGFIPLTLKIPFLLLTKIQSLPSH